MRKVPPVAVDVDGVSLSLSSPAGEVNILPDLAQAVPAGETVALVGPSGSGKTSLMMLIAGLERPSAGAVRLFGRRIDDLGEDALADLRRQEVGIVFQSFHLIPTMTALENVALPLELSGARTAAAEAAELLAAVGLKERLHHYPHQLSGGEQQRVAVARAFAGGPRLLLADEPTGNLDHDTGALVMERLFALCADFGATLILITHDAGLATRCRRLVRLRDGRIVADAAQTGADDSVVPFRR